MPSGNRRSPHRSSGLRATIVAKVDHVVGRGAGTDDGLVLAEHQQAGERQAVLAASRGPCASRRVSRAESVPDKRQPWVTGLWPPEAIAERGERRRRPRSSRAEAVEDARVGRHVVGVGDHAPDLFRRAPVVALVAALVGALEWVLPLVDRPLLAGRRPHANGQQPAAVDLDVLHIAAGEQRRG